MSSKDKAGGVVPSVKKDYNALHEIDPSGSKLVMTGEDYKKYNRYENYHADFDSQDLTNLTRYMEGQVLTLVEAVIADKQQLDAVKSLARKMLWTELYEMVQEVLYRRQTNPESTKHPIG